MQNSGETLPTFDCQACGRCAFTLAAISELDARNTDVAEISEYAEGIFTGIDDLDSAFRNADFIADRTEKIRDQARTGIAEVAMAMSDCTGPSGMPWSRKCGVNPQAQHDALAALGAHPDGGYMKKMRKQGAIDTSALRK